MVAPKRTRSTRSGQSAEDRKAELARKKAQEEAVAAVEMNESESEESDAEVDHEEQEEGVLTVRETSWDGPAVKRRPNGDAYYLAFILNGVRYAIGECVCLSIGKGDNGEDSIVIARIDNVWEDGAGVKWTELFW